MNGAEKKFHTEHHQQAAETHAALAKCMSKSADCHEALSKASEVSDPTGSEHHADIASAHREASAEHVKAGEFHLECCKSLGEMETNEGAGASEKAEEGSELRKLLDGVTTLLKRTTPLPDGLSIIPTSDARSFVPRNGQRAISEVEKNIAPELESVILDASLR